MDASDAISEGFNMKAFLTPKQKSQRRTSTCWMIRSLSLGSRAMREQKFLIEGTFPLGVPIIFAAAGDSGKGMMTLDMGMKIASNNQ